jgi:acyl-CoA dehydrogenase
VKEDAMSRYTADHERFRDTVRSFVTKEIAPHVNAWDEAEEFPRDLYRKAAHIGLLGLGYPEAYGGVEGDMLMRLIACEELARAGSGGLLASLFSHNIGLPPIVAQGNEALKARVLPPVLAGEKIAALAVTEPEGGSDVASIRTIGRRDGAHYVVSGEKSFVTSGMRADFYIVAVRTGGPGAGGISLLLIERDTPGFTRTLLKKMGWWMSDTASLRFAECRVPAENLIGEEHRGFRAILDNFNDERLMLAVGAYGFAQICYEEALDWARMRKTFGEPLVGRQVIRHKLVDMRMRIESTRAWLVDLCVRIDAGEAGSQLVAEIAMAKNHATQALQWCADQAVQILGGMGFMRGTRSERIYREVKVMMIGGGAEEIMKELAARQLGI